MKYANFYAVHSFREPLVRFTMVPDFRRRTSVPYLLSLVVSSEAMILAVMNAIIQIERGFEPVTSRYRCDALAN